MQHLHHNNESTEVLNPCDTTYIMLSLTLHTLYRYNTYKRRNCKPILLSNKSFRGLLLFSVQFNRPVCTTDSRVEKLVKGIHYCYDECDFIIAIITIVLEEALSCRIKNRNQFVQSAANLVIETLARQTPPHKQSGQYQRNELIK